MILSPGFIIVLMLCVDIYSSTCEANPRFGSFLDFLGAIKLSRKKSASVQEVLKNNAPPYGA